MIVLGDDDLVSRFGEVSDRAPLSPPNSGIRAPFSAQEIADKIGDLIADIARQRLERAVAAANEQNHDENGIIWPAPLAPYKVVVIPTDVKDEAVRKRFQDAHRAAVDAHDTVILLQTGLRGGRVDSHPVDNGLHTDGPAASECDAEQPWQQVFAVLVVLVVAVSRSDLAGGVLAGSVFAMPPVLLPADPPFGTWPVGTQLTLVAVPVLVALVALVALRSHGFRRALLSVPAAVRQTSDAGSAAACAVVVAAAAVVFVALAMPVLGWEPRVDLDSGLENTIAIAQKQIGEKAQRCRAM